MTGTAVTDGITAEDIERIVSQQETADRVNIDKEIEAGLKAIERELT